MTQDKAAIKVLLNKRGTSPVSSPLTPNVWKYMSYKFEILPQKKQLKNLISIENQIKWN